MLEGIIVQRGTDALLKEAETTPLAPLAPEQERDPSKLTLADRTQQFFAKEGVVAAIDRGADAYMVAGDNQMAWRTLHTDGGTIFVTTGGFHDNEHAGKDLVPTVSLAVEHYNRMIRILNKKVPVKMELNIQTQFYDENEPNGFNNCGFSGRRAVQRGRSSGCASGQPPECDGRHRQCSRQRSDDGSDADSQSGGRKTAPHHSNRAMGKAKRRDCWARRHTCTIIWPISPPRL
jgi:hypothetical protein